MVRGYGLTDSVTITSFNKAWLEEAAAYDSTLPKGWLVPMGNVPWDDSIIEQSKELGLTQICPRADLTTPELVDRIRAEGFVVRCHGLFNEDLMRHAVDVGADGATVNFPDKMAEYLRSKGIDGLKRKSESRHETRKVSTMTTTDKNKSSLKASYEFDNGRARIIHRGDAFHSGTVLRTKSAPKIRNEPFDSLTL